MVARQSLSKPARNRQIDVDDPSTSLAVEMMVGFEIPVVARRVLRRRNLMNVSVRDENFEIAIDRAERKTGHLG